MPVQARRSQAHWNLTWSTADVADALQSQSQRSLVIDVAAMVERRVSGDPRPTDLDAPTLVGLLAATMTFSDLDDARAVMVDPEQVSALPAVDPLDESEFVRQVRAPFPTTYFDLAGRTGVGVEVQSADGRWSGRLWGALVQDAVDALTITPVLAERKRLPYGMWIITPARTIFPRLGAGAGTTRLLSDIEIVDGEIVAHRAIARDASEDLSHAISLSEIALRILMLLESANVLLDAAHTRRRDQARVAAGEARLPNVVTIRKQSSRRTPSAAPSGRRVGVRHEVEAHYKHFPEDTRLARANPEKLREVRGRGRCVRVWCPTHVRGPEDQPLVIRPRRVAAAANDAVHTEPHAQALLAELEPTPSHEQ